MAKTQETEDVVAHARELRRRLNDTMPNAVGNTIDRLSDRIDVLARERDHWKNECKALCDVASEHTKARAALHQEGIEEGSDGRPDAA